MRELTHARDCGRLHQIMFPASVRCSRLCCIAILLLVSTFHIVARAEDRKPPVELIPESLSGWQFDYHERIAKTGSHYINIQHDGTIRIKDGPKITERLSRAELAILLRSTRTIMNRFFLHGSKGFNGVADGYAYELRLSLPDGRFVFLKCDQTVPEHIGVERSVEHIRPIIDKCLRLAKLKERTLDNAFHLQGSRMVSPGQRVPPSLSDWVIDLDDREDLKWHLPRSKVKIWRARGVTVVDGADRPLFRKSEHELADKDSENIYRLAAHLINRYTLTGTAPDEQQDEPTFVLDVSGSRDWGRIAVGYNRFAIKQCGVAQEFDELVGNVNQQLEKAKLADRLSLEHPNSPDPKQ